MLDAVRAAVYAALASEANAPSDLILAAPARLKPTHAVPVVIGFSGGRDSTALLDALVRLRDLREPVAQKLLAVHVHHGLLPEADAWAERCAGWCAARGVDFELRKVVVARGGAGLEANARAARYTALLAGARECGARIVLTAHHLDDRIETFLLQWSRGAGVDGLAAFNTARALADGIVLLRPFTDIDRETIDRYMDLRELDVIEDPSNADTRLARNAVRTHVVPALAAIRPGFRRAAARSIDLIGEAAEVLGRVAAAGLRRCTADAPARALRLDRLRSLPSADQMLVLRLWLSRFGIEAPPRARLLELLTQALTARSDARLLLRLGAMQVRRHRGLLLVRAQESSADRPDRVQMRWRGEDRLDLPGWGGGLRFLPVAEGLDADWLRAAPLEVRPRTGGERFKPYPTRPSKTLKRLFQDAGIAEFERAVLPLVWRENRLIFVPRLGTDARLIESGGSEHRIALVWEPNASLFGAEAR